MCASVGGCRLGRLGFGLSVCVGCDLVLEGVGGVGGGAGLDPTVGGQGVTHCGGQG